MGSSARAVVVTGCGVLAPLGVGVPVFWEALVAGRSAVAPIARFPAHDLAPRNACEVQAALPPDPDRAGAFALRAADEALADAGLAAPCRTRTGVVLGTTLGGMEIFERWDAARAAGAAAPPDVDRIPYFAPAVRLARTLGCRGPVATTQLACASGTHAVALAADWVRRGEADVVLAGGTDLLCRFVVTGFNALRATAERARPFDRDRRGLVLGEGAAVVVVEAAAHAAARGARVRARLLGAGAAGDAVHMTAPDREGGGAARAIAAALAEAGVPPAAVGFVSAHGTGTVYNDAMEAAALARVFGARRVPVNSIKGAIGHTLGAAGAFEVVACVQTLATGVIPPTAGLAHLDPACEALDVVAGEARRVPVAVTVSTSSGFAGTNAALVLGAP
ncbi:MAG TPA: beta-ketoacyl-[acyl-carrier-protein] synthase family protein [Candidatus Binatia bacterium]|nr:beta-ketoacyl-[acyl-carrier-protein] synthase family protein [Candidatus Binatia bacterium]